MNKEKQDAVKALKIGKGQIEAIIKMIEEERYCVDISNQIIAVQSLLKKSNLLILKQHMNNCVKQAIEEDKAEEKMEEIITLLSKAMGK